MKTLLPKSFSMAIGLAMACILSMAAAAQDSTSKPQPSTPPATPSDQEKSNTGQDKKTTQPPPVEAGGPQGDTGPIAIPKKKPPEEKPAVPERKPVVKNPEGIGDYSLRVNVPLVNVDVNVTTKDGQFIPGLKPENFRILEDGVPQKVTNFAQSEAPITAVMLLEFANFNYNFINDMRNAAFIFFSTLKKDDYVAVITYDMLPHIEVDFTQDKREVANALSNLRVPGFREANMFDALFDSLDRIENIEGRKYIILIGSGLDTFSKITYDKALAKVKASHNITIYTITTGRALRNYRDSLGGGDPMRSDSSIVFLQADNQMRTFAEMTGGLHFAPTFAQEMPEIFQSVNAAIRNQYSLTYHPTNSKQDGTYRKLKVELIAPDGGPLKVIDQKGKALKFQIIARDGYKAKQVVE